MNSGLFSSSELLQLTLSSRSRVWLLSSLVCVLALDSVSSLLRQNSLLVSPVSRWMASLPDTARWAAASSSSIKVRKMMKVNRLFDISK